MEIKKSQRADLEGQKSTGLLIGYIVTLAAIFVAFEYTTRDYVETDVVYSTSSFVSEEEVVPITQPIFTAAPPPPAEAPQVAEILDIVDNNTEIQEEEIQSTESTTEAVSGPVAHVSGPAMGPPAATQEEGDEGEVFEIVEQNPMFPGGNEALMKWLSKNLKYPASAQENGIQGRVLVQFVVNKDGSIVEPKVLRSVDPALDKEALRVVSTMPKWQPGKQRGKTVRVRFTLPVTFRLM
jgi:protein TonB